MDAFLLFCALDDSPMINQMESQIHARNFARTVKEGRKPGLTLTREGAEVTLQDWANELMARIAPVAALLDDQHNEGGVHAASMAAQQAKIDNPAITPSARVLDEIRAIGSAAAFGLRQSEAHAAYFRESPLMPAEEQMFTELADSSLAEQREIERTQTGNFDNFVAAYNSSTLCGD
jgi:glutamate--cysteine ligase